MYTLSDKPLDGNDRFEGFIVDLTKALADKLKFKYDIQLVADETYPGMIEEVKQGVCANINKLIPTNHRYFKLFLYFYEFLESGSRSRRFGN